MSAGARLRAAIKGEVSAADVEALLRGSGQLEDLRQQIEQRRAVDEVAHPGRPWETHAEMGTALAYFWVAQGFIAIARVLKEVDDESDPGTRGYMPPISHDQALALLRQAPDFLALTAAALANPSYEGDRTLPVSLHPRIEARGRCPAQHLKGMLRGAQYLDRYAQVEVESYCGTVAQGDAPPEILAASRRLQGELARAQSHLRTAEQTVSPILNGERVSQQAHEDAENSLWESLQTYVWLGQIVAIPALLDQPRGVGHQPPPPGSVPRTIDRENQWYLTSDQARGELGATGRAAWAENEFDEFWGNKRWRLSADEARYLSEVGALQAAGAISSESYLAECPFNPIWTAQRDVVVMGKRLRRGQQFAYNHHHGKGELLTGFQAVGDFMACEDD